MKLTKAAALLVLGGCVGAANADAPPNYGAVMGSFIFPDSSRDSEYGGGVQLLYGSPFTDRFAVELSGFAQQIQHDSDNEYDYFYGVGLDLRYGFGGPLFSGFLLAGGGSVYEDYPNEEEISPYANVGAGFLLPLPAPNLKLRGEGRYYATFNDEVVPGEDVLFDAKVSLGLQFIFDDLPARTVAVSGVADSDGDGVIDSHDRCPGTPAGVAIDGQGCPMPADEDGDGVLNANDQCPGTLPGTLVDTVGCSAAVPLAPVPLDGDSDRDGVLDSQDRCPNTALGAVVDPTGCAVDEDGDGVLNTADVCPSTPPGLQVNETGCVDRPQSVVLRNVNFEFGSARLTRDARIVLDAVAAGLRGQPDMRVEIAGHTDGLGPQSYNLRLSQERAQAVRAFLIERGIAAERMTAEGYGEFEPVAENDTEEGRAQNRRVEFRVLK